MKKIKTAKHSLEVLEGRIAPATVPLGVDWVQASHLTDGSAIPLTAGQGLSTGGTDSGDYLLYIEKGNAWIFTTDLNNNNLVDFNEITGIAAGDGLRMISFVDIHGDIATNLKETPTSAGLLLSLSDSNNNAADDNGAVGGDGRVILNSRIEKIELRTLTAADIPDQNGDGVVNQVDVDLRRAPSTHSIFGNIYAGRGFGVPGDATSGLLIDRTVITNFGFEDTTQPSIGSIRVGTAVSGEYFSFGVRGQFESTGGEMTRRIRADVELGDDTQGYLVSFVPSPNQPGASIAFVRSAAAGQAYNLNGLYAGDGGAGAVGGSIEDVSINGDDAGGYNIIAGNGGSGTRGGAGGSILRFSDLDSDTSKVVIRSGDGGDGSTNSGGNAGNAEFVNSNFYGNYSIILGDGGNGFTQGGNGASLAKAVVTQPVPVGVQSGTAWGTSHNPSYYNFDPSIQQDFIPHFGTTEAIDIDGDGFGDYVYSTLDTSQLVVMFGTEFGTFRTTVTPEGLVLSDRIYLASPRNAEAVAVGDLNGDGRPDIAAGSSDISNQAGISVFIAKWNDVNKDGDVMDSVDQFIGYYDPRYSALPTLEQGDPETFNATLGYWLSPHQIAEISIGDFDGDGANELAVVTSQVPNSPNFKDETNGVTRSLRNHTGVLLFLSPDRELDTNTGKYFLTGEFYADFGTRTVQNSTGETAPPDPRTPFIQLNPPGSIAGIIIEATALSNTADHDSLIVGIQGDENSYVLSSVDYYDRELNSPPTSVGSWGLGAVDTNRNVAQGNNPNTNRTPIGLHDFTVVDFDGDGAVDVIALSLSPSNYLVGVKGSGNGGGAQDSTGDADDQAGFFFGTNQDARGVKAADADGDGIVSDFVVLFDTEPGFAVRLYDYDSGPSRPGLSGPLQVATVNSLGGNPEPHVGQYRTGITDTVMWDLHYYSATDLTFWDVGVGPEARSNIYFNPLNVEPEAEPGLAILAGNGGNSFVGKGGAGGFIGGKGKFETIVDPTTGISTTDFAGAVQITFDGSIQLQAGNGGLGFSRGGNGGSISGVSVRDSSATIVLPSASLVAGDGGRGISGAGGIGGDLIASSIYNGFLFVAGDGGDGRVGGRGGSIIGNGLKQGSTRLYDTNTIIFEAIAGSGGNGLKTGGAGGSIVNVRPIIEVEDGTPGANGALHYQAGAGGNAVAGVGGAGGSVINSSPELNADLQDQILVEAGRGGNGTVGGAGGNITTFAVTQSNEIVAVAGLIAGHGGNGTLGAGGRGGSVTAVDVKAAGGASSASLIFPSFSSADDPFPTFFTYSRIMAGNGGASIGGRGGDGGTVANAITGATDGTLAVVAGAGGAGLTQGGLGGSVVNLKFAGFGSGANSKGIVIAGAGGDARAYIPNPDDVTPNQPAKSFGGKVGQGGHGGSINGIQQEGGNGSHFDLIAGNGGSTLNYGTQKDKKSYVGRGGSILNVVLNGAIGNEAELAPIRGYNDLLGGETMADFIERRMRDGEALFESLGDADGNVGIVVGASGRNKVFAVDPLAPFEFKSLPATIVKNGDLININVRQIMSAVAGSVDQIARIQLAQNITVAATIVGTDKGVIGVDEFLDENGVLVPSPVSDGRLIDGIFFAKALKNSPNLSGNLFVGPTTGV